MERAIHLLILSKYVFGSCRQRRQSGLKSGGRDPGKEIFDFFRKIFDFLG